MLIADALSRNYPPEQQIQLDENFENEEIYKIFHKISNIKLRQDVSLKSSTIIQIEEETEKCQILQKLKNAITEGWPQQKSNQI